MKETYFFLGFFIFSREIKIMPNDIEELDKSLQRRLPRWN